MSLDNLGDIRQYRERVEEKLADGAVAIALSPGTMLTMLDTLLGVIEEQDRILATGKDNRLESVTEVIPLHQRRKIELLRYTGPDLSPGEPS